PPGVSVFDPVGEGLARSRRHVFQVIPVELERLQEGFERMPDQRDVARLRRAAEPQLGSRVHRRTRSIRYSTASPCSPKILKAPASPAYCTSRANCGVRITRATGRSSRWALTQKRSSSVSAIESA